MRRQDPRVSQEFDVGWRVAGYLLEVKHKKLTRKSPAASGAVVVLLAAAEAAAALTFTCSFLTLKRCPAAALALYSFSGRSTPVRATNSACSGSLTGASQFRPVTCQEVQAEIK